MALAMFTISTLLSLGYVIKYSGMDTTLGLAAAKTQKAYPILSPLIGFLGVLVAGSATTSNVLFGSLQVVAADQIGVNHVQMAAANVCGGAFGHILSTSSMVVAAVATGADSRSVGPIARGVGLYAISLVLLLAGWNMLVTYAFPSYIPSAAYTS
jgi:lactate permease